jgi:hypothetical protein
MILISARLRLKYLNHCFLTLLVICSFISISFSQDCSIKGKKEWQKVVLNEMVTQNDRPDGSYKLTGEWVIDVNPKVKSIADLSEAEAEKIKRIAAKHRGCIVYIDFRNPMDIVYNKKRSLYFYWFRYTK